ncbi:MAG: hypothetical protein CL666_01270 [Balneola sp.]|nr:hypothetical protein [Balneola sp.]|tara:strand:- start:10126 stop:11556 length:1431 start_codon:yes stop_codon:yes gene_type:complete
MKIPFFEHTVVTLDVRNDTIRWVELNHIGNKLSYVSHGSIREGGLSGLKKHLHKIKEQIQSDAYQLSCSFDDILIGVEIEDMPYFEETEEIREWIEGRKKEYKVQYKPNVEVGTHVAEVDEDYRRCIFQMVNKDIVHQYKAVIEACEMYPALITTGISELGYALIYEETFISGQAAIIIENEKNILCSYQNGLLKNVFEVGQEDFQILIEETDSYLRTEEVSHALAQHTIPLFTERDTAALAINERLSRPLNTIFPLKTKLGEEKLDQEYAMACGVALKSIFPNLDEFNFSPPQVQEKGREWVEKKECYRTGVLLLPPLIVILLILFAIEGFLDVNLTETNQVLTQLSDKIELVNDKTEQVNLATLSYQQVRNLVDKRRNSARLFELVSSEIPSRVWLQDLSIRHKKNQDYLVIMSGVASRETMIADFMGALENNNDVEMVELLSSQKVESGELPNVHSLGTSQVNLFQLRIQVSY